MITDEDAFMNAQQILLLQLAMCYFADCGIPSLVASRIVNAREAAIQEMPWMVSIIQQRYGRAVLLCSGFIITEIHIITAAHCVIDQTILPNLTVAPNVYVGVGSRQWRMPQYSSVFHIWM